MDGRERSKQALQDSLLRVEEALARPAAALERSPAKARKLAPAAPAAAFGGGAALFLVLAIATGHLALFIPALVLALVAGLFAAKLFPAASPGAPRIGLGASIGEGAVVEPGASVEMGADVKAGAIVRAGAVVRMGASIGRGAVIERNAIVSWGADVKAEAVVGEGAVVGAGADVKRGARVPPGARLLPGSDFGGGAGSVAATPRIAADPRQERLSAICDKLDGELRDAGAGVRELVSTQTILGLRRAGTDLLRREDALRAESDPAALARLDAERSRIEARLLAEGDVDIRRSLQGAVAAIEAQRKQRALFKLGADRLEAEQTRLFFTLESLASLFARLRAAGSAAPGDAELSRGVEQLESELSAIADALDDVSRS